jgi:FkbM family methyltransferase
MEGLLDGTPFSRLVANGLGLHRFTLVDIGCSGGIDTAWGAFGPCLRAFGFDPNLDEVAQLTSSGSTLGVEYIGAFISATRNDSMVAQAPFWERSPAERLSVFRTLDRRARHAASLGSREMSKLNLWPKTRLADPHEGIFLPDFLRSRGVDDIDFIKIDVDGADFQILRSLQDVLEEYRVLGVGIEVNFFGSDNPDIHTFHNVDRLMKAAGFELFGLTVRRYSVSALPAPYLSDYPTQTEWGRPFQGDAIYLRDAAAPEQAEWSNALSPHKLVKLASLFSLAQLPDCAAEVLQCFAARIGELLDEQAGLEALLEQCKRNVDMPADYMQYMSAFDSDSTFFFPRRGGSEDTTRATAAILLGDSDDSASAPHLGWIRCEAHNETQTTGTLPRVSFATPSQPYAYGVLLRLDLSTFGNLKGLFLATRFVVNQGSVGVGLLTSDETEILHEQFVRIDSHATRQVITPIPLARSVQGLLFRTGDQPGPSEVQLLGIELWRSGADCSTYVEAQ